MISVRWGDGALEVVSPPTTEDYWHWLEICHHAADTERRGQIVDYVPLLTWLAERLNLVPEMGDGMHPVTLGFGILRACEMPLVTAAMELNYQIANIDMSGMRAPCECLMCQGKSDKDEACLYGRRGITEIEKRLARCRPELIARYWSLPYSLYCIAVTESQCERLNKEPRKEREPVGIAGRSTEQIKQDAKRALRARRAKK